jgi:hypothetical protein
VRDGVGDENVTKFERAIAGSIDGEYALDGDRVGGKELGRPVPEASRLHTLFVGVDLGVGEPAEGVDGRVHVDVGARRMTLRVTIKTTSVDLPPTSGRYLGQLLHVDMKS